MKNNIKTYINRLKKLENKYKSNVDKKPELKIEIDRVKKIISGKIKRQVKY